MVIFFFFNDTATTEIYTLSLHDALPICSRFCSLSLTARVLSAHFPGGPRLRLGSLQIGNEAPRSEEHTSELQSRSDLVCRLLLEKKKQSLLWSPCYPSSPSLLCEGGVKL